MIIDVLNGILVTGANPWLVVTVLHVYTLQDYFAFGEKNFFLMLFIFIFFCRPQAMLENILHCYLIMVEIQTK